MDEENGHIQNGGHTNNGDSSLNDGNNHSNQNGTVNEENRQNAGSNSPDGKTSNKPENGGMRVTININDSANQVSNSFLSEGGSHPGDAKGKSTASTEGGGQPDPASTEGQATQNLRNMLEASESDFESANSLEREGVPKLGTSNDSAGAAVVDNSAQPDGEDEREPTFPTEPKLKPKKSPYSRNTTPQKGERVMYRKSKGVSIDSYNPEDRRPFTDPLTIEACRNLGVEDDELFYPTERDLFDYTRDKELRETVRRQLRERVDRTREAVRAERDRIASMPPPNHNKEKTTARDTTSSRGIPAKSFEEMERERIEKMTEKNRRQAKQVILSILIEKEIQEETEEAQRKEKERIKKYEEELKIKHREERKRHAENIRKAEEAERLKKKEDAEKMRQERLKEEMFNAKRKEQAENLRKEFERLEASRRQKLEQARQIALKAEEEKFKKYEEQRKAIEQREEEFRRTKEREVKEREAETKRKEQENKERLERLRQHQLEMVQKKKEAAEERKIKQERSLAEQMRNRDIEIQKLREREEAKHNRAMTFIEVTTKEREKARREAYEANERKYQEKEQQLKAEKDKARLEGALIRKIKLEERYKASARLASLNEANAKERAKIYEERLKQLELEEAERRRRLEQNERVRLELEKKKQEVLSGDAATMSELRKKGSNQISKLASQLNIDLDELKQQAKQTRRGQRKSFVSTSPQSKSNLPSLNRSNSQSSNIGSTIQ